MTLDPLDNVDALLKKKAMTASTAMSGTVSGSLASSCAGAERAVSPAERRSSFGGREAELEMEEFRLREAQNALKAARRRLEQQEKEMREISERLAQREDAVKQQEEASHRHQERATELAALQKALEERAAALDAQQADLAHQEGDLAAKSEGLRQVDEERRQLAEEQRKLEELRESLAVHVDVEQKRQQLKAHESTVQSLEASVQGTQAELDRRAAVLAAQEATLKERTNSLARRESDFAAQTESLDHREQQLHSLQAEQETTAARLGGWEQRMRQLEAELEGTARAFEAKEAWAAKVKDEEVQVQLEKRRLEAMKSQLAIREEEIKAKQQKSEEEMARRQAEVHEASAKLNDEAGRFEQRTKGVVAREAAARDREEACERQELVFQDRERQVEAQQQDLALQRDIIGEVGVRVDALRKEEQQLGKALEGFRGQLRESEDRVAQLRAQEETLLGVIATLKERERDMNAITAQLRQREEEVTRREQVVRQGQSIIGGEIQAALQKLRDRELAVEKREVEHYRHQRELSLILSKERLLERARIEGPTRSGPAVQTRPNAAVAETYGGGKKAAKKGQPPKRVSPVEALSKRERPVDAAAVLAAEARLLRFVDKLYACVQTLRGCYDRAFLLSRRDQARQEANQTFMADLAERGVQGLVQSYALPEDVDESAIAAEVTTAYRTGKQQLEDMLSAIRSAELSLAPSLGPAVSREPKGAGPAWASADTEWDARNLALFSATSEDALVSAPPGLRRPGAGGARQLPPLRPVAKPWDAAIKYTV